MSYSDASRPRPYPALDSTNTSLEVRQQPQQALVTSQHKEKTRKAIDPPPIVQLKVRDEHGADQGTWLVNPFLFMNVVLVEADPVNGVYKPLPGSNLLGSTVSSLHRLKDITNKDGGFFVFADISCRRTGVYRLQFNLFDIEKIRHSSQAVYIKGEVSEPFHVVTSKDFRGQMESTHLSRTFSDQGVRLRLRKEQRTLSGSKRGFRSSPHTPSTSSVAYNMQGGLLHDQPYGFNAAKRQRSDSDYNPQLYHTPQLASSTSFTYGTQPLSSSTHQSVATCQAEPYGGILSQGHPQGATLSNWPRHVQQEPLPTPVGGIASYNYLSSSNTTANPVREQASTGQEQYHGPQYRRIAEQQSTPFTSFHSSSTLSHPPVTPHQHQGYVFTGSDGRNPAEGANMGPPAYNMHHQQPPSNIQSHFGFQPPSTNPPIPAYEARIQPATSNGPHNQHFQVTSDPSYGQEAFTAGQELFSETSPQSISVGTPLDTGVLNTGFMPPHTGPSQESVEQNLQEYKEQPYPSPHQSVLM